MHRMGSFSNGNEHIFPVGATEKTFEFLITSLVAFLTVQLLQNKDLDSLCENGLSVILSFYNSLSLSPFIFPLDSVYVVLLTFASQQLAVSPLIFGL